MTNIDWKDPALVAAVRASIARHGGKEGGGSSAVDLLDRLDPDDPQGSIDDLLNEATLSCEASRLLLDVRRFPKLEPPEVDPRRSSAELESQWQRLQARWQTVDHAKDAKPEAGAASSSTWLRALAAVLALACVALTLLLLGRGFEQPTEAPIANLALISLVPESAETPRDHASPIDLADRMNGVFLVLTHALVLDFADYGVEIRDGEEQLVWESRGLRQDTAGFFTVSIPRDLLTSGQYKISLSGYRGAKRHTLAAYSFTLAR